MTGEDTTRHFWADEVADEILAADPAEPIIIKGGISPSGVPHLGNANEIVLGHFVAEVLRDRGLDVRQVFTSDDRDPLRKLPRRLADLDGNLVDLGDVNAGALGRNLGRPYTDIPDPFGCCDSYGDHFTRLIADIADQLDIPIDIVSTTALYEEGQLDDAIRLLLRDRDRARDVLEPHQRKVDEDYVPFRPICENCGKLTETVTGVDLDTEQVSYRCTDSEAGNRTIEGCGHEGVAGLRDGKLPWRFEWVAQWEALGVDFEPFGKDHAEGSWPSGVDIAEAVFDIAPPVPMVYEWFTLEDEPFSSSAGHVVLVSEVLELVEPEVLRYFFSKDPGKSRDFSIERIDQLVDEFDRFEAIYFDEVDGVHENEPVRAKRVYPFLVNTVDPARVRIPYRFAAVLGMTDDPERHEAIARKEGHLPADVPEEAVDAALERVDRARRWAARTDNEFNYRLARDEIPNVSFDEATNEALDRIADIAASGADGDELQGAFFRSAEAHDISAGTLFTAGYQLFLNRSDGPKLGPFLADLDREFVIRRLRQEA